MIVLKGNVPSLKNSKQIVFAHGRRMIIPSESYSNWREIQLWELKKLKLPKYEKCKIEITFFPDNKRKSDLDNKAGSIMEILRDAGIIMDDNWWVVPELTLKFGGVEKDARVEINITNYAKRL